MSHLDHTPSHTILLVDSDGARRRLFTHHLARQRYLVYQAAKLAEARLLLQRQRFDALVVDRDVEDGGGLVLLREIAAGSGAEGMPAPPLRIYIESEWPSAEKLRELTEALGVTRVLQKPLTPGELTLQLEASLSRPNAAPPMLGLHSAGRTLRRESRAADDEVDTQTRGPSSGASSAAAIAGAALRDLNTQARDTSHDATRDTTRDVAPLGASYPLEEAPPPLPDDTDGTERELAVLKGEYARALGDKLETLRDMLASSHQALEGLSTLERAHALAHEIHGTAGSFGYMQVSAAAAVVESALADIIAADVDRREVRVWREIDAALERALTGAREGAPEHLMSPLRRSRHTTTLLVVDEDPDLLAETQRIGRDNLLQVLVAQSAHRALALARAHVLDGALIDVDLPSDSGERDGGVVLARALREIEGRSELPLAFLSREGSIPDRVAATHAGAALFLTKPLVADELMQTARSFTADRHREDARVLIIDEDDGFVAQISGVLAARRMRVEHLREPQRVLEALERSRPDIVLLDTVLPHLSGYDICKLLRASPRWQKLPVIFLTRQTTRRARLACFEVGGDDYLQKPVLIEELLARLQVRLDRLRLDRAASGRDALTGLMTRSAFLSNIEGRLAECRRRARPLSLALIEVDDLGAINHSHGQRAGDDVLVSFGRLLARRFRLEDMRCRWSGSEFVVAWGGERGDNAQRILARALAEFRQLQIETFGGQVVRPSFSAGIATFPDDGGAVGDLVRVADARLAHAKDAPGRERIVSSTSL